MKFSWSRYQLTFQDKRNGIIFSVKRNKSQNVERLIQTDESKKITSQIDTNFFFFNFFHLFLKFHIKSIFHETKNFNRIRRSMTLYKCFNIKSETIQNAAFKRISIFICTDTSMLFSIFNFISLFIFFHFHENHIFYLWKNSPIAIRLFDIGPHFDCVKI